MCRWLNAVIELARQVLKGAWWLLCSFFVLIGATNDLEPALKQWREWGIAWGLFDAFSLCVDYVKKFSIYDIILCAVVVVLSSFFVWAIQTKPRREVKEKYFRELEQTNPGLKERQRGRRARRRRRRRSRP